MMGKDMVKKIFVLVALDALQSVLYNTKRVFYDREIKRGRDDDEEEGEE